MNDFLNAKQLQKKTGLSRPMIYKILNEPDCPIVRIGRSIRVLEQDFDRWFIEKYSSNHNVGV